MASYIVKIRIPVLPEEGEYDFKVTHFGGYPDDWEKAYAQYFRDCCYGGFNKWEWDAHDMLWFFKEMKEMESSAERFRRFFA